MGKVGVGCDGGWWRGIEHEWGRTAQVNVVGARVPSVQSNVRTEGVKPVLHCVVHDAPLMMVPPPVHALVGSPSVIPVGAEQGLASKLSSIPQQCPR